MAPLEHVVALGAEQIVGLDDVRELLVMHDHGATSAQPTYGVHQAAHAQSRFEGASQASRLNRRGRS